QDFDWKAPRISSTSTADYLHFNVARVLLYERQGLFCEPQPGLGSNLFSVTRDEALAIGRRSEFILIARPAVSQVSVYPFEKCMRHITPQLVTFCERNLTRLQTFRLGDTELTLYVRPTMKMEGDSDGWITSN